MFLNLYPKKYREEYGDELQTVFTLSLNDALNKDGTELVKTILREFSSLPKAIIHEHLRERRRLKMTEKSASRFDFEPGSRNEALVALAPFLFGMVMVFIGYLGRYWTAPMWAQIAFVVAFWSSALGLFLLGSAKGLPRWFLPYLGLPLPIISVIVFNSWLDEWKGFRVYGLYERSWFLGQFVFQGLLWVGMIGSVILLVLVVRLIPRFYPFYKRLRNDWTLLCFVLYGAMPFVLVLTFEEYKYEEPYMILALSILAAGGWMYLRNDESLKKFLSLYAGMVLSMLTAAVGKAVILPIQDWPVFIDPSSWKNEAMSTMIMWIWLALIMLIPGLFRLFTRPEDTPKTA